VRRDNQHASRVFNDRTADASVFSIGMSAGIIDWCFLNRIFDFAYHSEQGMKAARQLGIVILLLVSYLTPAMACMVSDARMNAEERACCRAMKNHCEEMGMPASHGCCQKTPKSAQDNALDTKAVTYHPVALAVDWFSGTDSLNPNPVATGLVEHANA
jgi:hypothetical protein